MRREWLVKYDLMQRLVFPFFLSLIFSLLFISYGSQLIYMGHYMAEGVGITLVGVLFLALTIFFATLSVSFRTFYTRSGVTRKFFKKTISYKWKNIAQIHLITKNGRDYFYFLTERTPAEVLLMSKLKLKYLCAAADEDSKNIVVRCYRRPIRHFNAVRSLKGSKPRRIRGRNTIKIVRARPKQIIKTVAIFIMALVAAVIIVANTRSSAVSFALFVLPIALITLNLKNLFIIIVFNDNGSYAHSLFMKTSLNKYEVKSYGIYTDKDSLGGARKKYIFLSKYRMQTHEVQYCILNPDACRRYFLAVEFDGDIFALIKSTLPFEPQRVAKKFY